MGKKPKNPSALGFLLKGLLAVKDNGQICPANEKAVGEMNLRHYSHSHMQQEQKFHVQPTHSFVGFW